eukprot:TRINITY_DN24588_c0_g1_i1.p1 TRINITY_DN24588_c0_g1~~TRINITY_DN24588_c0_g1_i1.p1  ORF type:complete len:144 (-),score=28.29 TRINITY_DN24588_c0_g1_i1:88-519(-)
MLFRVQGLSDFELEVDPSMTVCDVKKLAKDHCCTEPEYMRFIYNDRLLKDDETMEPYQADGDAAVQVLFTAGQSALVGGSQVPKVQHNPFGTPVRGLPGSKGDRLSRVSGRPGGMGLIRKYGIMMKRQEFREKAREIGFVKYR